MRKLLLCCAVWFVVGATAGRLFWSSGITTESAVVSVQTNSDDELQVSTSPSFDPIVFNQALSGKDVHLVTVSGLSPNTLYYYRTKQLSPAQVGRFRTFPDGPADMTIAFASCAKTGYESPVFREIADLNPALFLHMGDLHYEHLETAPVADRLKAYEDVFESKSQSYLFQNTPIAYVWDDHDFGPNNADGLFPHKDASRFELQKNPFTHVQICRLNPLSRCSFSEKRSHVMCRITL